MFNTFLKSTTKQSVSSCLRNRYSISSTLSCNINNVGFHCQIRSYASFVDQFLKELKDKDLINNNNNNNNSENNINKDDLDLLNSLKFGDNNNIAHNNKNKKYIQYEDVENELDEDDFDAEENDDFVDKNELQSEKSATSQNNTSTNKVDTAKKSKKHRPHVNPLAYRLQLAIEPPKWDGIFKDMSLPFHFDLGCGKGEMLVKSSVLKPNYNYIGFDIRNHCIDMANSSKQLLEFELNTPINNLHFMETNVSVNLFNVARSLPPNSIQKLSLLFPDPWHKRKHIKRRIVNANFVREVAMILPEGAKIYIMSDVYDLYDEMLNHFIANRMFEAIDFTKDEWDLEVTGRQNYYMEKDIPFWRAVLVRTNQKESNQQ